MSSVVFSINLSTPVNGLHFIFMLIGKGFLNITIYWSFENFNIHTKYIKHVYPHSYP